MGGDLDGYRRVETEDGRACFAPRNGGPTLEVKSRVEKRFLGRTEIAVFETVHDVLMTGSFQVKLRHIGRLKRSGVAALPGESSELSARVAEAFSTDQELKEAALPLDFTRFEIEGGPDGCRSRVELMGASHVAVALPPMRSYVRLYPDQLEALAQAFGRVDSVLSGMMPGEG